MSQFTDALGLSLLFVIGGSLTLAYYQLLPSANQLRARLPNRGSISGVLLAGIIGYLVYYIIHTTSGRATFFGILILLYHLLIFEGLVLLFFRFTKSNILAVLSALLITAFWAAIVVPSNSVLIFNITYLSIISGAPSFLLKLGYLRTRFLSVVAILWSLYDLLSNIFIYPAVYLPAARPIASFRYPSFISGQLTLGLGDMVWLSLFTLAIWRDLGPVWSIRHIIIQSIVLLIVAAIKPPLIFFPYLIVMSVIFFSLYWWAKKGIRRGTAVLAGTR